MIKILAIERKPLELSEDYKYAIEKADIIVFLVGHKEFVGMDIRKEKLVLDFCGINKI